ncbi:hypothetical protein IQ07DRAFT_626655 [Pyrenochaeta sp. DS3sAY3a]|nr:hypothetical protein IQ07DRAFT_626655 [Pyrenochaeta sp. DS3sAY3a]
MQWPLVEESALVFNNLRCWQLQTISNAGLAARSRPFASKEKAMSANAKGETAVVQLVCSSTRVILQHTSAAMWDSGHGLAEKSRRYQRSRRLHNPAEGTKVANACSGENAHNAQRVGTKQPAEREPGAGERSSRDSTAAGLVDWLAQCGGSSEVRGGAAERLWDQSGSGWAGWARGARSSSRTLGRGRDVDVWRCRVTAAMGRTRRTNVRIMRVCRRATRATARRRGGGDVRRHFSRSPQALDSGQRFDGDRSSLEDDNRRCCSGHGNMVAQLSWPWQSIYHARPVAWPHAYYVPSRTAQTKLARGPGMSM